MFFFSDASHGNLPPTICQTGRRQCFDGGRMTGFLTVGVHLPQVEADKTSKKQQHTHTDTYVIRNVPHFQKNKRNFERFQTQRQKETTPKRRRGLLGENTFHSLEFATTWCLVKSSRRYRRRRRLKRWKIPTGVGIFCWRFFCADFFGYILRS